MTGGAKAGICPRCRTNPRHPRPDGRLRSWCKQCESQQKGDYARTPAGRATYQRWYLKMRANSAVRGTCFWCAAPIERHGARADDHMYCNKTCRDKGRAHLKRLGYAARKRDSRENR